MAGVAELAKLKWTERSYTKKPVKRRSEMANERIKFGMTAKDLLIAMSGGNPGALGVCVQILEKSEQVDPDALLGGLGVLMSLDTLKIYEHRIWMLYKDVCGHDLVKMLAVLRAHQLGGLAGVNNQTLNHAIDNRGAGIDLDAVVTAVKERLSNFQLEPVTT